MGVAWRLDRWPHPLAGRPRGGTMLAYPYRRDGKCPPAATPIPTLTRIPTALPSPPVLASVCALGGGALASMTS
jgi:hypothetical protein